MRKEKKKNKDIFKVQHKTIRRKDVPSKSVKQWEDTYQGAEQYLDALNLKPLVTQEPKQEVIEQKQELGKTNIRKLSFDELTQGLSRLSLIEKVKQGSSVDFQDLLQKSRIPSKISK